MCTPLSSSPIFYSAARPAVLGRRQRRCSAARRARHAAWSYCYWRGCNARNAHPAGAAQRRLVAHSAVVVCSSQSG
eukprot:874946-Pleurochrysis_carterae.AAC.3